MPRRGGCRRCWLSMPGTGAWSWRGCGALASRTLPIRRRSCFQQGNGQAGLDQHQLRLWLSFHRHTVLSMCALALLAVTTARPAPQHGPAASADGDPFAVSDAGQPAHWRDTGALRARPNQRPPCDIGIVRVTVPEACRLSTWSVPHDARCEGLRPRLVTMAKTTPGARPMASLPGTTPGGRSMTRTINPAAGCPNTRGRCAYPGPAHRLNRSAPYCPAFGVEQHGHAADRVRRRGQRLCEGSVAIAVPAIGAFFEARECNGQASVRMHRPQHPAVRLIDPRTEERGPLADVGAEIALVDPLHNCGIVWFDLCPPSDPDLAYGGGRIEVVDDHSDWSAMLRRSWKRSGLGAAEPETLPLKQEPQAAQQRRPRC